MSWVLLRSWKPRVVRQDLVDVVYKGRMCHLFEFCRGYDLADWEVFGGLFKGLRKALGDDDDDALEWENWGEIVLHRYTDDDRLKHLLSQSERK